MPQKQSMSELKLRRLQEHMQRLQDDLARPRAMTSESCTSLIRYCRNTRDPLIPAIWGETEKSMDPYAPPEKGCGCVIA